MLAALKIDLVLTGQESPRLAEMLSGCIYAHCSYNGDPINIEPSFAIRRIAAFSQDANHRG